MDPRKREIDELEAEISRLDQQISADCGALGRQIADLNPAPPRPEELLKYLNSVQTLRHSEEDFRRDILRIRDTARRLEELEAAVAEGERRLRDLQRERESRCVEIGAGAYTVYRALPDRDRYRPFFEEVLQLDAEIRRLEGDLKALEDEDRQRGLFEKLRTAGRKIALRGSINRIEKQKIKAFAEAGARVVASDFANLTAGELRNLFEFSADKQREIELVQEETRSLREEMEKRRETLHRYGVDDDPERGIENLEKRIADVRREQDVINTWIGQFFVEKDLRTEFADASLSAKYEIISGIRQSILRKKAQIHRLRAELEIEELQKKEKALRQRRKQLEDELKSRERQIAAIDVELSTGQRRIDELRRVITGDAPFTEAPPLPPTPDFYARRSPEEPNRKS